LMRGIAVTPRFFEEVYRPSKNEFSHKWVKMSILGEREAWIRRLGRFTTV